MRLWCLAPTSFLFYAYFKPLHRNVVKIILPCTARVHVFYSSTCESWGNASLIAFHLFCHRYAPSPQRCARKKSSSFAFNNFVLFGSQRRWRAYVYALMSRIQPPNFIWHRHRFLSLNICSSRRGEEAQHRGYGKSPSEVHLASWMTNIRLQLERVLHARRQIVKAAHSSPPLINMKLNVEKESNKILIKTGLNLPMCI
jgi:hypothetical protein